MEILREIPAVRQAIRAIRASGGTVALVPTMGALHDGHISLVRQARTAASHVVATIFVNPKQFGPNEDLSRYPRQEMADSERLASEGCNILFAPNVDSIYPAGFASHVHVDRLGDGLEGAHRPGHFDGVTTVVSKLFNIVDPDIAFFGEKDWQQLAIIRRMARDLDFPIDIRAGETVRDSDGLALSSRNAYLSAEDRARAVLLPATLNRVRDRILAGEPVASALQSGIEALQAGGFGPVDYLALVDAETLEPLQAADRPARLAAAAKLGGTRLIDNIAVDAESMLQ